MLSFELGRGESGKRRGVAGGGGRALVLHPLVLTLSALLELKTR